MDRRVTDQLNGSNSYYSVIGEKTKIRGSIEGNHDLIFEGQFEGEIKLNAMLIIKQDAVIKGNVEVDSLIIEGQADGDVLVHQMVEVRTSGHFEGEIVCQKIAIEEGAFFQGNVKMQDGQKITPIYFKEKRKELQD